MRVSKLQQKTPLTKVVKQGFMDKVKLRLILKGTPTGGRHFRQRELYSIICGVETVFGMVVFVRKVTC